MTERAAKEADLRQRARALKARGNDVTQWLEEALAKAQTDTALMAVEVELAARELERGKLINTRWLAGFAWIFVIVVIIAHALSG